MQRLKNAKKKAVGFKQSLKAVERGHALVVYVAKDIEDRIRIPIMEKCLAGGIPVVEVDTMMELGAACGIQVGSSVAAVINSDASARSTI
jgi:large subunit ribosomal protein L7A